MKVFVAGTLSVMRWSPDPVLDMPLPFGCCVEEVGYPVVSTTSKLFSVNFVLSLIVVLTAPSYQRPRVFPP